MKRVITPLLAMALMALPASALAGDDTHCVFEPEDFPAAGAQLPTNPILFFADWNMEMDWSGEAEPPVAYLDDGAGNQIDLDSTYLGYPYYCSFFMAFPVEDLLADTTYELVDDGGYVTGITFTTGTGPDETAPSCEIGAHEDGDPMHVWISCDEEIALARVEAPIDLGSKYYLFTPADDFIHFEAISGKYEGGDTETVTFWDMAGNSTDVDYTFPGTADSDSDSDSDSDADSDGDGAAPVESSGCSLTGLSAATGLPALLFQLLV